MGKKQDAENTLPYYISGAVAAAVIPIPIADAVAISTVQVSMVMHITHGIYERDIGQDTIKSLVANVATSGIGNWAWSLLKTLPGLGTAAGIAGQMVLAGTLTGTLGLAIIQVMEKGGDLNADQIKRIMKDKKGEAEKMAEEAKNKYSSQIDDMKKIDFKCLTTEVNDILTITFNANHHQNTIVEIRNSNSEVLHTHNVRGHNQRIDMPFGKYPKGAYSAVFKADNLKEIKIFFVKL